MNLSDIDRKLIVYLQLQADASLESASKDLKISISKVRSSLKRLLQNHVMYPYAVLNHHRLGLIQFDIYFSPVNVSPVSADELLSSCLQDKNVPWVVKVGGDFQLGITVLVKSPFELEQFLARISRQHGSIFKNKSVVLCLSYSVFPRKYLAEPANIPKAVSCASAIERVSFDDIDKRILGAFSFDPLISRAKLAQRLGMNTSTLQYRLTRLRAEGVIEGIVYSLNASKVRIQTFRLFVQLRSLEEDLLQRFHDFCRDHGQVSYLTRCVGAWDHEITLEVRDPMDVERFQIALNEQFSDSLSSVKTVPVFDEKISGPYPFAFEDA